MLLMRFFFSLRTVNQVSARLFGRQEEDGIGMLSYFQNWITNGVCSKTFDELEYSKYVFIFLRFCCRSKLSHALSFLNSQILTVKSGEGDYRDTSYVLRQASPFMEIKYNSHLQPKNCTLYLNYFLLYEVLTALYHVFQV